MDLVTISALVLLLMLWLGWSRLGERGRTTRCSGNLKALGSAVENYAAEHKETLPPASISIEKYQTTWDLDIFSYLKPGLPQENDARLAKVVPRYFACPSDALRRSGIRRSYAMAGNDMKWQNWPAGGDVPTGTGLIWNEKTALRYQSKEVLKKPELLSGLPLSQVPSPADTVLLTELVSPENIMGKLPNATVSSSIEQRQSLMDGGRQFHGGKFNYLMVDGHVETLSILQTGAMDGGGGIWTIKKGD